MNKNVKKFKDWHWKIYQNYLNVTTHLTIWWLIRNKKYVRFARKNREFFSFDASAHLTAGTLALMRIFDPDPRSICLRQFLKFSLDNRRDIETAFPKCKFCNRDISNKIKKEIDGLEGDLRLIRTLRNKLIAHEERNFKRVPIKWKHFQKIIDFLERNILDYGSRPNQIFLRAKRPIISKIEEFFDKHFKG